MGCSSSKPTDAEHREAVKQNATIDKMLRMDKKKFERTIKILLLGTDIFEPLYQPAWAVVQIDGVNNLELMCGQVPESLGSRQS
jgi:hypothetical protein